MTTVSVIIATHSRLDELTDLLQDLTTQSLQPTEILVVDSSAGEDSSGVVKRFNTEHLPVRHLLTENVLSTKRNHGAANASGELLVILDDDLRVRRNFIAAHVEAHTHPGLVVSGSITFPTDWVEASNYYRFKNGRHAQDRPDEDIPPQHMVAMNHSIEHAAYLRIGGYDEDYRMYGGEDLDFGMRSSRSGLTLRLAPEAEAIHQEVRMTWTKYLNKVHKASFYGLPLVIEKNPEAAAIPTVRIVTELASGSRSLKERFVAKVVDRLASRGALKHASKSLEASDNKQWCYAPVGYMLVSLLANRVGYKEHQRGEAYEPLLDT